MQGMSTTQVVVHFRAEGQTFAMLDYPPIAKVLEPGLTQTDRPFFVQDLDGGFKIACQFVTKPARWSPAPSQK